MIRVGKVQTAVARRLLRERMFKDSTSSEKAIAA
jgi:hypothetical protein